MVVNDKFEAGNNGPDIKNLLGKKDINGALAGLGKISQGVIEGKREDLSGLFEVAQFSNGLDEKQTYGLNNIFSQYLQPKDIV